MDNAGAPRPAAAGQPFYNLNFTPSGTYTATQDLNNGFLLNQLNLAGAVTLAGTNSLAFAANGTLLPQFNQNSSNAVTVSAPVNLTAMTSFGGTGGGSVTLTGLISGAGGLTKDSPGMLQIYGLNPNTYSGGTVVNSGTLHLGTMHRRHQPALVQSLGNRTGNAQRWHHRVRTSHRDQCPDGERRHALQQQRLGRHVERPRHPERHRHLQCATWN